jgi:hypothetical protein
MKWSQYQDFHSLNIRTGKQAGRELYKLTATGLVTWTQQVCFVLIYANNNMLSRSLNNSHTVSVFFSNVTYISSAIVHITTNLRGNVYLG